MQSLLLEEGYGTKEYAKIILQKNHGKAMDTYISSVMLPALKEGQNDLIFLKKHLHTISLIARNIPERSIFANHASALLDLVLQVRGDEDTTIEQIRVLYRLVQNYSDRLHFVPDAYDRILQFVITQLDHATTEHHVTTLMCMDFLRIMVTAVPEPVKKHDKEILSRCLKAYQTQQDWLAPELSELLTLIAQLVQLSLPKASYHHPTCHQSKQEIDEKIFEKLLQADAQSLFACIYVAGAAGNTKWISRILSKLLSEFKTITEESKDNRTSRLVLLKAIRKTLQYYDPSETKLEQSQLDELLQTLTYLYQTAQDSGKKIYKQKVEVSVTKIMCILLNRFSVSELERNGQTFLQLPILANLPTHPNMYPIYSEYVYAVRDQEAVVNELLGQIVPKLLQRITKLREKTQIETNKKEPLTSKTELILTLNAISSIAETSRDLFKPFLTSTLDQVEFLLFNCLVSVGVDSILTITKLFTCEFQPKKFIPICNKFLDILKHQYEQDKIMIRSDKNDEGVDVESDLNLAVLDFFTQLLLNGSLKVMLENASNHIMTLYHFLNTSIAKELMYETDYAERIEQSKLALLFLQESAKLGVLQAVQIKEFFIHHMEALKFSLQEQDSVLAIEFLNSVNELLKFEHNGENLIMTTLLAHLNENSGKPVKKKKQKENSVLQVFNRHLKGCAGLIRKYEFPEQGDFEEDEEEDEFSRQMETTSSEELKKRYKQLSEELFENLKRFGFVV